MNHASDKRLVEIYYGGDKGVAEDHVASCESCRMRYHSLKAVLDSVEAAPAFEPGPEWEERMWLRLTPLLERGGRRGRFPFRLLLSGVAAGFNWRVALAMAAMLIAGFMAGRYRPHSGADSQEPVAESSRQAVRLAALSDHLDRSEFVLMELLNTNAGPEADISLQQRWAGDLLAGNRLLRQAAEADGDLITAAVLDDLERILLEVVHEPSTLDAAELDALRRRVESGEMLFRVRLLGRQLKTPDGLYRINEPSGRS